MASGGVTSGNAAASDLENAVDHDPSTVADVGSGAQYLQIDLGSEKSVNSLLVMRDNADMRIYKGVVYRLSTTADFSSGVTAVFHNDNDNLHGLGLGESTDTEYQETENGRYVRFAPVSARFVRLYSAGSNYDTANRYREVLVGTQEAGTGVPPQVIGPVAEPLIAPTAIAQTQGNSRTDYGFNIDNLIDGDGLSATPTTLNLDTVTHNSSNTDSFWVTSTEGGPDYFGDSRDLPNPQFTLTLDGLYSLSDWWSGGCPRTTATRPRTSRWSFPRTGGTATAVRRKRSALTAGRTETPCGCPLAPSIRRTSCGLRSPITRKAAGSPGLAGTGSRWGRSGLWAAPSRRRWRWRARWPRW